MGFLLKIILFGVAIYAVWKTFARWKGMYDRFVGKPEEPARRAPTQPPPAAPRPSADPQVTRKVVIEDTVQCAGCGAYLSAGSREMQPLRPPPGLSTASRVSAPHGAQKLIYLIFLSNELTTRLAWPRQAADPDRGPLAMSGVLLSQPRGAFPVLIGVALAEIAEIPVPSAAGKPSQASCGDQRFGHQGFCLSNRRVRGARALDRGRGGTYFAAPQKRP